MLAYKYRSSSQFDFALDIVFNDRLYCADWTTLNDPMEGLFSYHYDDENSEADFDKKADQIINHKNKIKICSLSETPNSILLWAHYANGFDGFAIEVEIPDPTPHNSINKIEYQKSGYTNVDMKSTVDLEKTAKMLLCSKFDDWEYEKEVRVIQEDSYFNISPIKRIIAGHRLNPALFKALETICKSKNIALHRTKIEFGLKIVDENDQGTTPIRLPWIK